MKRKAFLLTNLVISGLLVNHLIGNDSSSIATAAGPEFIKHSQHDQTAFVVKQDTSETTDSYAIIPQSASRKLASGGVYPIPNLELASLRMNPGQRVYLKEMPELKTKMQGKVAGLTSNNEFVFYTVDPELQALADQLVRKTDAAHVAIVAMEPKTGKILAIAEKSNQIKDFSLYSGLPAASLFKLVTTAAGLESEAIRPYSTINFRGGDYSLTRSSYMPDKRKDKRSMTVTEALGKSCNAVFGRLGGQYLSSNIIRTYVEKFGFNSSIGFESSLRNSSAYIPESGFELSRTAAGFGEVKISPLHAATLMSGIANDGLMPRPYIVNHVMSQRGQLEYQARPEILRRIVSSATSKTLLSMMQATTTVGTSRKEFTFKNKPLLSIPVAAKTGTLSGDAPKGLNHWFVAAAPANNPKIALSVIVVSTGSTKTKASRLGKQIIEEYLGL